MTMMFPVKYPRSLYENVIVRDGGGVWQLFLNAKQTVSVVLHVSRVLTTHDCVRRKRNTGKTEHKIFLRKSHFILTK